MRLSLSYRLPWQLLALAMLTVAASCHLGPISAQDTIPIAPGDSITIGETTVVAPPAVIDTVPSDSASAPPKTVPTPTEFTLKGWLQAILNGYYEPIMILLSSLVGLKWAKWFPQYAKFGTVAKAATLSLAAMGIYTLMRYLGGTPPDDVVQLVGQGFGPVVSSILTAFGVGYLAKETKIVSTAARLYYNGSSR